MSPSTPRIVLAGAALLLALPAAHVSAQDVLERARRASVPVPQELVRRVQEQPGDFEFRRAWRQKVGRIRQNRAALEAQRGPELAPAQLGPAMAAVMGELAVPTLGGLYAGQTGLHTSAQYEDRLFGEAVAPAYSVRTFYREMSGGVFEAGGVVPTWPTLPYDATYYRPDVATDPTFGRTGEFLRDVLNALDSSIDFGQFDNDGLDGIPNSGDDDGFVDVAAFLYQDAPASCGGPGIWPHRWYYGGWWGVPYATGDPAYNGGAILVDDYMIQSGVECDGTSLMQIGTYAHELGHALALPDLYDTDGGSEGVGEWDLMGSGNWNVQSSPAHMGGWSKDFLGWASVTLIEPPAASPPAGPWRVSNPGIVLPPVQSAGDVLRYDLPGTLEHYLLEHREPTGSEASLHGPGLLVWHIDQGVIDANWTSNRVNANPGRYGVDLEEADGLFDLDLGNDRGDAGDPFPGTAANTAFGAATTPNSLSNDGFFSGLTLSNIALNAGVLSFDADLATGLLTVPAVVVSALPGDTVVETLSVTTFDGSSLGLAVWNAQTWLTVDPDTADTPFDVTLTFDATLLDDGTYVDTVYLQAAAMPAPHKIPVTLRIPGRLIALGDSVVDSLTAAMPADTFEVDLAGGAMVDFVMYSPDFSLDTWLDLYAPGGALLDSNDDFRGLWSMIPAFQVPADGRYRIVARGYGGDIGNYVLKVRPAGAVVATIPGSLVDVAGPVFGIAEDTLWLFNAGSGTADFTVGTALPWLSLSPATGTLPAAGPEAAAAAAPGGKEAGPRGPPAKDAPRREPLELFRSHGFPLPSGAVPIVVTADLGLAEYPEGIGYQSEAISVTSDGDAFGGSMALDLQLWVHSASLETLADGLPYWVGDVARHPSGDVIVTAGGNVERVDPLTGARTVMGAGVSAVEWSLAGLAAGPDGAIYVIDGYDRAVKRVLPDGTVETVWTTEGDPYDVTVVTEQIPLSPQAGVAPAQSLYVIDYYSGLWHVAPDGSATNIYTGEGAAGGYSAVFYNPYDGWVYYTYGQDVYRYDPDTGVSEFVLTTQDYATDIEIGTNGTLYAAEYEDIGVYEMVEGTRIAAYYLPDYTYGLALVDGGWLVGGTHGDVNERPHRGVLFRIPVDDSPLAHGGTYLVADWPTIVVPAGGSTDRTLTIATQDGSAVSVDLQWDAPWLTVQPVPQSPPLDGPSRATESGTTPVEFFLSVDASALAVGTYVDTIEVTSASVANSPYQVPVRLHNGNLLVLGDSVRGQLDSQEDQDTVAITLPAAGAYDIAVFPTEGSALGWIDFQVVDANGTSVASSWWRPVGNGVAGGILAGWTVWGTTPHTIVVSGGPGGGYVLKARPAGPVAMAEFGWMTLAGPEGGAAAADTVYLFNTGPESVDWAGESLVPWLTLDVSGGTLPAGSPEAVAAAAAVAERSQALDASGRRGPRSMPAAATAGERPARLAVVDDAALAPPGSVPVVLTAALTGLPKGHKALYEALRFWLPSDPWGGDANVDVEVYVHEGDATIVTQGLPYFTSDLARLPDGDVVMLSDGDAVRVDPASGARTLLAGGLSESEWGLSGVAVAPDGAVYVVDQWDNRVLRIDPSGPVTQVADFWGVGDYAYDVAVGADGTVYVVGWYGGLFRLQPESPPVHLSTGNEDCCHQAVVFDPLDGRVYFSAGDELHAYDPASAESERVGEMRDWPHDLEVGSSGLIYAHFWDGIRAYGVGSLFEQARYASAGWGWGIALLDGQLWATTDGCCGNVQDQGLLYRVPVPDGFIEVGGRYLSVDAVPTLSARQGETVADTVTVAASDGSAIAFTASWVAPWLSVSPAAGTTPGEVVITADATGLAGGSYTENVVFTSPDADADLTRVVRLDVAHVLALGDSIVATIPLDRDYQSQILSLVAGQVVDIAAQALSGGFEPPIIRLDNPDGSLGGIASVRSEPFGSLVAGFEAPVTGEYHVRVFGDPGQSYKLKSRLADDVIVGVPQSLDMWSPGGAELVVDTLWVFNTGPGTPAWQLVSTPPSWLSLSVTSGTLAPAAEPFAGPASAAGAGSADPTLLPTGPASVTRRPPPAGATAIVVTADPSDLPVGGRLDAVLELEVPGATWAGNHLVEVQLSAVDPALDVVASLPFSVTDLLVYTPAELVVGTDRDLWKVDRATGAASVWVADLGSDQGDYPTPLAGIEHAGDGAVYVADQMARRIYRVESDGTFSTAMTLGSAAYDPIVLPGGTLVASTYDGFYRREADGSATLLAEDPAVKRATYNPIDGWIYYATLEGALKRLHPVTRDVEHLLDVGGWITDMQWSAGGYVYVVSEDGFLFVVDGSLEPVMEFGPVEPHGFGVALGFEGENVVYLTSQGFFGGNGHVYSRTVEDFRAPLPDAAPGTVRVDDGIAFSGQHVTVGVYVDVTSSGKAVGGFDLALEWDPEFATFVSVDQGDFVGSFESNPTVGRLDFAGLNADDAENLGETRVASVTFQLPGASGATAPLQLLVEGLDATDFSDLSLGLLVQNGVLTIATGTWGDPNRDGTITALDALMCLTVTVDRPLPEGADASSCDVAPDIDSDLNGVRDTFDGTITALDALAILSHVVSKALPAEFRVGDIR